MKLKNSVKGDFDASLITHHQQQATEAETFETNMGRAFTLEEFFYNGRLDPLLFGRQLLLPK